MRSSLYIALFVAFIDFVGVGLIYPIFPAMLFDETLPLLPIGTSAAMRGTYLGLLLALMSLAQFFSAPLWGALSDAKGRKKPLLLSLIIALIGYITALCGVAFYSITLLLASRVIIGFASGNTAIVQAAISDLSQAEEKAKNFGFYSMALGVGFALGPFFGGILSAFGYSVPFVFAAAMIALNLIFTLLFFKESHFQIFIRKINLMIGIAHLKKAFRFEETRVILAAYFFHTFGWSFFYEFFPVYLIVNFKFSSTMLGFFFGAVGCFYGLGTGLLIRPAVNHFKPETVYFGGIFLTAMCIFSLYFLPSAHLLWPMVFLFCYFVAHVTPTAMTIVSNNADTQIQGEALGVLSSINAAALVISPLFSGSIVGKYPALPIFIGGGVMVLAALIVLAEYQKALFRRF